MGYQALITLDLPSANDDQRETFYQVLKKEKWQKLPSLTTTWKISFKDNGTRSGAVQTLKNDMLKAKRTAEIQTVQYALQLAPEPLVIEEI